MAVETKKWDVIDHLDSPEAIAGYLEAVFEDGEPSLITAALGDIARAQGMSSVARETKVTREALYKALSENGDPRLSTFMDVVKALGLKLEAKPV